MANTEKTTRDMAKKVIQYGEKGQKNYSPLNIRAVVISPNGVLVFYHDYKAVNRPYGSCGYVFSQVMSEMQQPKYKTVSSLLTDPACSALEEIIYLTKAVEGGDCSSWLYSEQENRGKSIKWQRLYKEYTMNANFLQFRQFIDRVLSSNNQRNLLSEMRTGTDLISKVFNIPYLTEYRTWNERWYENWAENFASTQYPLNQPLFNRFMKIKSEIELKERNDNIKKMADERNKAKAYEADKAEIVAHLKDLEKYLWVYGLFTENLLRHENLGFLGGSHVPLSMSFSDFANKFTLPYIEDIDLSRYKYIKFNRSNSKTVKRDADYIKNVCSGIDSVVYYILINITESLLAYFSSCDMDTKRMSVELLKSNDVDRLALYVKCSDYVLDRKYESVANELQPLGVAISRYSSTITPKKDDVVNLLFSYFALTLDLTNPDNDKYVNKSYLRDKFFPNYIEIKSNGTRKEAK